MFWENQVYKDYKFEENNILYVNNAGSLNTKNVIAYQSEHNEVLAIIKNT